MVEIVSVAVKSVWEVEVPSYCLKSVEILEEKSSPTEKDLVRPMYMEEGVVNTLTKQD